MWTNKEDELVERLKAKITGSLSSTSHAPLPPPVTREELDEAERSLGFALPPLVRRIYGDVSDGGFGPGYGLLRLTAEENSLTHSVVRWYLAMRSMTPDDIDLHWADESEEDRPRLWPEKLLTMCDNGCNIYSCIDCSQLECPVYREDSNISFCHVLALESPSLYQWLTDWLDDKQTFNWEHAEKWSIEKRGAGMTIITKSSSSREARKRTYG